MFSQDSSSGTVYSINKWSLKGVGEGATKKVVFLVKFEIKILKPLVFGRIYTYIEKYRGSGNELDLSNDDQWLYISTRASK